LVHPEIISHTASAFGLALPWSIPSGFTNNSQSLNNFDFSAPPSPQCLHADLADRMILGVESRFRSRSGLSAYTAASS